MAKFIKAEYIFNDLPQEIQDKIIKRAAGKLVYFPVDQEKMQIDREQICINMPLRNVHMRI